LRGQGSRHFSCSYALTDVERERNIFKEAEEESEEEAAAGRRSLLDEQRYKMAQEPVWTGEERMQDTILRMVMDKYKPLRVDGSTAGQHPADVKLSTIQKPSMLSSPSFGREAPEAALVDVEQISSVLPPPGEDGRRLEKTPHDKPWAAVYVNPMRREGDGSTLMPSVHYGKYIGLPRSSSNRILPKTASGKERLKMAGIKTETLPLDDRNKMRAIREGVRRWDRAGRMRGVKEEAFNYRRMREEQREKGGAALMEEELEEDLYDSGVLKEGEEMKLTSGSSDSKPGEAVIAMSGGRGYSSLANERIERMMNTDYFRRNSLRGKPFERDIHAMNPFLKGEERIMNRLIQKQGASPPWVELNSQVESETNDWRTRTIDNWVRRASRMILSSSHLRRGLEPIRLDTAATISSLEGMSLSAGQKKLITLVEQYRDAEWVAKEASYHEVSLKEVNNVIRKYNVVAPSSVRKGLLTRERELQRAFEDGRIRLIRQLSQGLDPAFSSPTFSSASLHSPRKVSSQSSIAANASNGSAFASSSSSFAQPGTTGRGIGGGDEDSIGGSAEANDMHQARRGTKKPDTSYMVGLTSIVRRIKEQLVGR
jgi:DnaJ family protein C protein 28